MEIPSMSRRGWPLSSSACESYKTRRNTCTLRYPVSIAHTQISHRWQPVSGTDDATANVVGEPDECDTYQCSSHRRAASWALASPGAAALPPRTGDQALEVYIKRAGRRIGIEKPDNLRVDRQLACLGASRPRPSSVPQALAPVLAMAFWISYPRCKMKKKSLDATLCLGCTEYGE